MVGEILETYQSLRLQAKKALGAESTWEIISRYHRGYWRELRLCLNPHFWSITGPATRSIHALAVPLPHAEDPDPTRTLVRLVDRSLMEWLWKVAGELEVGEGAALRGFARNTPRLEREMFGSPWKAAS